MEKGIAIIEVLVAAAILGTALSSILGFAIFSFKSTNFTSDTFKANNMAREAVEAVRNFRDNTDWPANGLGILIPGQDYFPRKTGSNPVKWELAPGQESADGFGRKIVFERVFRDPGSDNIIESGGTEDPNTRKVTVEVSWKDKKTEIITYLTNWR